MDQKISLEDLKNGVEPQEEKEEVNYQAMVAAEAAANAQAYKERVLKERAEKAKAEQQQAEEEQAKAHEEHMQKVYTGDEAPDTTQEYFDGILHNINKTMERKKYEKSLVDDHFEEVAAQQEEDQEVEEMMNDMDTDGDIMVDLEKGYEDPCLHHPKEVDINTEIPEENHVPTKSIKEVLDDEDDDHDLDEIIGDDDDEDYLLDDEDEEEEEDTEDESDDDEDDDKPEFLNYTPQEEAEALGKAVKEKIRPIEDDKRIDLSAFKKANKKVSVSKVLKAVGASEPNQTNWGLFNTGLPILMEGFKGQEIATISELIAADEEVMTTYNKNRQLYGMLYQHDKSESKPESFTDWLKQISIRDDDHLFMALYRAAYSGANYINYRCPECGEVFVSDSLPLYKMVKFATKEDEQKADKIMDSVIREPQPLPMITEQISENYVMDFKDPSLYNIMIEGAVLDNDYIQKHSDLVTYISYIDNIYYINRDTMELEPIELTKYDKNLKKQIATKIKRYTKILRELTEDQLNSVSVYINEIASKKDVDLIYIRPEIECPRCQHKIPEEEASARNLVFTRHQLALLATM